MIEWNQRENILMVEGVLPHMKLFLYDCEREWFYGNKQCEWIIIKKGRRGENDSCWDKRKSILNDESCGSDEIRFLGKR